MKNDKFNFWQKWLTYSNIVAVIIGILVAFAGNSIVFEIHNDFSKDLFFLGNEFNPEVLQLKNWLFGIIGGTMVGFHLLVIMISENAFKKRERWAYLSVWIAMLSWFTIDSGVSIYYGAIYNVVIINMVALLMICLPLIMTRNEFKKS